MGGDLPWNRKMAAKLVMDVLGRSIQVRDVSRMFQEAYTRGFEEGLKENKKRLQTLQELVATFEEGRCESLEELEALIRRRTLLDVLQACRLPTGAQTADDARQAIIKRIEEMVASLDHD